MTLQQLRYVIQIAASGSITAAASVLYMRQPSLSKSMSELEGELGVHLFERSAQGVTLTDEGERFVVYAREVVERADRLEDRYKDASGPRGTLSISAPHDAAVLGALTDVILGCGEQRFEFRLRETSTEQIMEDVRTQRSELGFALRSARNANAFNTAIRRAGLRFAPLTSLRPSALVSRECALAKQDAASPKELEGLIQVVYVASGISLSPLDAALVESPPPMRHVHVSDWGTACRLIGDLKGYAIVCELHPQGWRSADLVSLPIKGANWIDPGIVSVPGMPLSQSAHDFAKILASHARIHQQLG